MQTAAHATSRQGVGRDVVLTPGMSMTAEVKIGNRRVLEFLLDPLWR